MNEEWQQSSSHINYLFLFIIILKQRNVGSNPSKLIKKNVGSNFSQTTQLGVFDNTLDKSREHPQSNIAPKTHATHFGLISLL